MSSVYPEDVALHSSERLALNEGDSLLQNGPQILAALAGALERLNEDLELVPIAADRFLFQVSCDVRDGSPRRDQFLVVDEDEDIDVARAVGLAARHAAEAENSSDRGYFVVHSFDESSERLAKLRLRDFEKRVVGVAKPAFVDPVEGPIPGVAPDD